MTTTAPRPDAADEYGKDGRSGADEPSSPPVTAVVENWSSGPEPDDQLSRTWTDPGGPFGWIMTVQNGPIANRFILTAFVFFLLAGLQALLMRIQLARPENDFIDPLLYNQLFTVHGSTMMFLFAVPIMEAFANFLLPVMLGARELPFPRMTAFGYWTFLWGGLLFYSSFLFGAAPDGGWYAYLPLTSTLYSPGIKIDFWLLGLSVAEVAAIGAGIELTVAIMKMRAPGMSLNRTPIYAYAILTMGFMMLFGFTPLLVATTFLELDRKHGTQFFNVAAGGDPLLWQHLFWIFGHPDVYIMFIPAIGMISMIIPTFARRPLIGFTLVALAMVTTGIISFGLWVHHMFTVGISWLALAFFGAASFTIALASGTQVFAWIATIWSGRPVFKTPFLFALGFLFTFVIGGLSGVMVAAVPFDWQVHDTYFLVAHFHYVLVGGVVFPIFAGLYYWLPKNTGYLFSERVGKWVFWLIFIGFNVTFFPMHVTGLLGMPRRYYTYQAGLGWDDLNLLSTVGTVILTAGVGLFVVDLVRCIFFAQGEKTPRNPWGAGTLDFATVTPPSNSGYRYIPIVRSRYPLWEQDGLNKGDQRTVELVRKLAEEGPTTWRGTFITSILTAEPLGIVRLAEPGPWPILAGGFLTLIFIAELFDIYPLLGLSILGVVACVILWLWPKKEEREIPEVDAQGRIHGLPVYLSGPQSHVWWAMALVLVVFSVALACMVFSYYYLGNGAPSWPPPGIPRPGVLWPLIGTAVLGASVIGAYVADWGIRRGRQDHLVAGLAATWLLGLTFVGIQLIEYTTLGFAPSANAYASIFFTLSGYQTLLVLTGLVIGGVVLVQAMLGYFTHLRFAAVQNVSLYFSFALVSWLVVFVVLYVSPYLLALV